MYIRREWARDGTASYSVKLRSRTVARMWKKRAPSCGLLELELDNGRNPATEWNNLHVHALSDFCVHAPVDAACTRGGDKTPLAFFTASGGSQDWNFCNTCRILNFRFGQITAKEECALLQMVFYAVQITLILMKREHEVTQFQLGIGFLELVCALNVVYLWVSCILQFLTLNLIRWPN